MPCGSGGGGGGCCGVPLEDYEDEKLLYCMRGLSEANNGYLQPLYTKQPDGNLTLKTLVIRVRIYTRGVF